MNLYIPPHPKTDGVMRVFGLIVKSVSKWAWTSLSLLKHIIFGAITKRSAPLGHDGAAIIEIIFVSMVYE